MHYVIFLFVLVITWPIRWLSYPMIHRLGAWMGSISYYLLPYFRKKTMGNLAMATNLRLTPEEIKKLAKASFQNLMITCLEYPKLASEKNIDRVAYCENKQTAEQLIKAGKSVIFFCGHQANWEILFLEGTHRMPGVAIGRPIKNKFLYQWVVQIRQKFGGKIIPPQQAIKEGLKALKKGMFLGIVGDQGMPDSGFSSLFFGRTAYTSPIPAILSYRTGSPIIVATTQRIKGHYYVHYSDPIWPDQEAPMNQEVDRMMRHSLSLLEESIRATPDQWLWLHNRWKLQPRNVLKRPFRYESIAIFFPPQRAQVMDVLSHLPTFASIYPQESFLLFVPEQFVDLAATTLKNHVSKLKNVEIFPYKNVSDLLITDYRLKLIFNFSGFTKINSHFKKQTAFTIVDPFLLKKQAGISAPLPFSEVLKKAILQHPEEH